MNRISFYSASVSYEWQRKVKYYLQTHEAIQDALIGISVETAVLQLQQT